MLWILQDLLRIEVPLLDVLQMPGESLAHPKTAMLVDVDVEFLDFDVLLLPFFLRANLDALAER